MLLSWTSECAPVPAPAPTSANYAQSIEGQPGVKGAAAINRSLFPQLWCAEGQYSLFGVLFFAPLLKSLQLMFQYQVGAGGGELMPARAWAGPRGDVLRTRGRWGGRCTA